jgi:hypothetical protein
MKGILYLINILVSIANAGLEMREYQRKINEREIKTQAAAQTFDAKIAAEHNKNELLEVRIERERLENLRLKRKLGITEEEVTPDNY